jgi:uncharacterized Zn-finger protein
VSLDVRPLEALTLCNSWDFRANKNPKCPHCGTDCAINDLEWWQLYEEGEHEVECPVCELEFTVSTAVQHSFSTDEQGVAL